MSTLAFDIETVPNPDLIDSIPAPNVKFGNTKDPEKIREKMTEAREEQLFHAALDPHFARVIVIAMSWMDGDAIGCQSEVLVAKEISDAGERDLIQRFDAVATTHSRFVTFNGAMFDVPFLVRRRLLTGLPPGLVIEHNKYRCMSPDGVHWDLCLALNEGISNPLNLKRNLHFYAKQFLNEEPPYGTDLDKSTTGDMLAAGDIETIKQIGSWDASVTLRLANVLKHYVI